MRLLSTFVAGHRLLGHDWLTTIEEGKTLGDSSSFNVKEATALSGLMWMTSATGQRGES